MTDDDNDDDDDDDDDDDEAVVECAVEAWDAGRRPFAGAGATMSSERDAGVDVCERRTGVGACC